MSSGEDWCTIESDPGVFTELLEELGCTQVQLEELLSIDDETLQALQASGTIYGLIFLFQWQGSVARKPNALPEDSVPDGLFFAHQVTTNACATQAILSVVLNSTAELGPTLSEFRDFTASFPPSLKGEAISSSEPIKKAHNAFGRTDAFLHDGKFVSPSRGSEDVFHFVAYVPKDNQVYELDGLQTGPIIVGEYDGTDPMSWLNVARNAIQERMQGDAIKFNLMAVIQDKRLGLQGYDLEVEEAKRAQWKLENQRRRHNYVPLCVAMIKELARMGKLPQLVEEANARKRQRLDAKKK